MAATLIRPREAMRRCGIGRSTMWKMIKDGDFPKPVRITRRTVGFVEAEINDWVQQRIAASRGDTIPSMNSGRAKGT